MADLVAGVTQVGIASISSVREVLCRHVGHDLLPRTAEEWADKPALTGGGDPGQPPSGAAA